MFKNKKVVVTGGSGFIGTHFINELLDRGAKVKTSIHKNSLKIQDERIEVVENIDLEKLDEHLEIMKRDKLVPHYVDWFYLYIVTDNLDYLDLAYKRLHELSKRVDSDLKEKLFNYPLSIRIMKEWENKLQQS